MKSVYLIIFVSILASCATEAEKKVLILGKGKIDVQENSVVMNAAAGSVEKEIDLQNSWKELQVETPSGKKTIAMPSENGYYILNLKNDSLIGSYQKLGVNLSSNKVITQEELKRKIDSLTDLTLGKNIGQKVFLCIPGQLLKISSNHNAKVYGPYKSIPRSIKMEKGSEPEIYKFYTNAELKTLISNYKESSIYYRKEKVKIN